MHCKRIDLSYSHSCLASAMWVVLLCVMASLRLANGCGGGGSVTYIYQDNSEEELRRWCFTNCLDHWSPWTTCSEPCAGGTRRRTRGPATHAYCDEVEDFTCTMPTWESDTCNEFCVEGLPSGGGVCQCPNDREGQCCELEIQCPYPDPLRDGSILGTWPASVGAVATFECDEGFTLVGNDLITCTGNNNDEIENGVGTWSGATPTCTQVTCDVPEDSDHLELLNRKDGYVSGDLTYFRCEDGYELVGPESRECTENGWSGFTQICDPISCPDPGVPLNGGRDGNDLTFGSVMEYSCNENFRLVGSTSVECLASGTWLGHIPTCEELECDPPYVDEHGSVRIDRDGVGIFAAFSCDDGYTLVDGPERLQCVVTGGIVHWDGFEPSCDAIECGDPGTPENGYRGGAVFRYPNEITFACFHGYQLQGQETIACQIDGQWSGGLPTCDACPVNTWAGPSGECVPCPDNAHTATVASTNQLQCVCDVGYTGENGGPCFQVQCTQLLAPQFGQIENCDTLMGGICNFTCDDGYVMSRGSDSRLCQSNGAWSGTQPFCEPCPMHTYKASERSCSACPINSGTTAPAQMLNGCICDEGYDGPAGGPCNDVDECADGSGPCEDSCFNLEGSYICSCDTPGYVVDEPDNLDGCRVEQQCVNITREEAPLNGGVVCNWFHEANSIYCSVRCNYGYEPIDNVNSYETCGPTTGYQWSFITEYPITEELPDCMESFFPDFSVEAYLVFTTTCSQLTPQEIAEVKQEFAYVLNNNSVCAFGETTLCDVSDMAIICGEEGRRKRRQAGGDSDAGTAIEFRLVAAPAITDYSQCTQDICDFLRIPEELCEETCFDKYRNFFNSGTQYARNNVLTLLTDLSSTGEGVIFTAAGIDFVLDPDVEISISELIITCQPGYVYSGSNCLPCPAGTYHDVENDVCVYCPVGRYQPLEGQTSCPECDPGTTTTTPASIACTLCPDGMSGLQCQRACSCVNGFCEPFNGTCICPSGWEGANCEIDIDGCESQSCFPGVACVDAVAPSTGFTCGDCPPGFAGDGITCIDQSGGEVSLCPAGSFGPRCQQVCTCVSGDCDSGNGGCSCHAGWSGVNCDQECADGTWGLGCRESCRCAHGNCDHVTGECHCDSGWMGERCDAECPAGQWSFGCAATCDCMHGSCDPTDGSCTCTAGWTGDICNRECNPGFFGINCGSECSCVNGVCNSVTGSCLCDSGWRGTRCHLVDCMCAHGVCNGLTGECACQDGWEGTRCEIDVPGCRDGGCFPGVACSDVAAPGTGFTCASCPTGYHGDGVNCELDTTTMEPTTTTMEPTTTTTEPTTTTREPTTTTREPTTTTREPTTTTTEPTTTTMEPTTTTMEPTTTMTEPTTTTTEPTTTTTEPTTTTTEPTTTTTEPTTTTTEPTTTTTEPTTTTTEPTTTTTVPTTTTTEPTTTTTVPTTTTSLLTGCVSSCSSLSDGNYQSCHGCDVYASCVGGSIIDDRPCVPGTVWDDGLKHCTYTSTTCPAGGTGDDTDPPTDKTTNSCVDSCTGLDPGNYHSCQGCTGYVTCVAGGYLYEMGCSWGLVWDDDAKMCLYSSTTCP